MTRIADQQTITETVTRFFQLVDLGCWTSAHALLTNLVTVAHGSHHETLSSQDLIAGWKRTHARFKVTRYRLASPTIELIGRDRATAQFDSHVTFFLTHDATEPTMAIDGQYTTNLERAHGTWLICSIRHDQT